MLRYGIIFFFYSSLFLSLMRCEKYLFVCDGLYLFGAIILVLCIVRKNQIEFFLGTMFDFVVYRNTEFRYIISIVKIFQYVVPVHL